MTLTQGKMPAYCAGAVFISVCAWGVIPAKAAWNVTEVPVPAHWTGGVEVTDINSSGVVCGNGNYVVNATVTAFRFDGGSVTELPHLTPSDPISLAVGINATGVVCGYSRNATGDSRAVYWEGSTLHTVPYPPDANTNADLRAYGINDAGVIVGYCWNTNGVQSAWYSQAGVSHSLGDVLRAAGLVGSAFANAVSDENVICGNANDAAGIAQVWTYDLTTGLLAVPGVIGTDDSSARAINAHGQTIGRGQQSAVDRNRALTYDGVWHLVDPSVEQTQWGEGINDHGRMVGFANTNDARWGWYSDGFGPGSMRPVNLPGWTRIAPQAINNRDQIAGYGRTAASGADSRGFIVSPPPGDADHDGDIDGADWAAMADCLSGPHEGTAFVTPTPACLAAFDFSPADGDVDLADVVRFQTVFEGP